jgi:serine/threonine-protein kinase
MKCPKCDTENPDTQRFCGDCGTQLEISEDVSIPTKTIEAPKEELTTGSMFAGRYQIIEEIGKGGMGKVYKVLDKEVNAKIALKLIKPEIATDKKVIERFRNELRMARDIAHKNVCRMYDLNKEDSSYFITMEYVDGEDLKGLIRKMGRLSSGQAISIAKQVCDGLTEAHKLGVVHRDLKPQNIMIDRDGNARIMDFGIARSLSAKGITGAGVMIGTPDYMSPEQVEGKETDQRSDIYSLGIILYEMVTGRVPFEGDTPFTIGVKHKSEIPKDPKEMNTQIPDDLSHVILRCLEKEKDSRYQSAEELHSDLANIEKGLPTSEILVPERKPITSKEITVQFRVKKYLVPVFLVLAVGIIAIAIWQLRPSKEEIPAPPEKPSIAVLPFEDRSPQKDQGYLCDGLSESIINALIKVEGLRVPARSSSFSFKDKEQNAKEIGEILNTKTILEGSLQKAKNRIRISAQLIDVADGSVLWSKQIDKEEADIFSIQDEITLAVVDELRVNLLGDEKENLKKRYTENIEAYNLYLQGRYFWNKRTKEGIEKSIEYFQEAIDKDPTYALAYVGISDSYNILGDWNFFPSKEVYPKAKKAAEEALELDDLLGEAHISLADYKAEYEWDWEGAEKEFKRGLELNPDYPSGHQWYSEYLLKMSRFIEALEEANRAIELDPLAPIILAQKAYTIFFTHGRDGALEQLQKTLDIEPHFRPALFYRAMFNFDAGSYKEAFKDYEIINFDLGRGLVYAKTGKMTEAKQILETMIERAHQEYIPKTAIAILYFETGDKDTGFIWLEKAFEERERNLTFIKIQPGFDDDVRSDPRFKAILKKMNLDE